MDTPPTIVFLSVTTTLSQLQLFDMHSIDEYPDERTPMVQAEHMFAETHDSKITRINRDSKSSVLFTAIIGIFGRMSNLSCQRVELTTTIYRRLSGRCRRLYCYSYIQHHRIGIQTKFGWTLAAIVL